MLQHYKKMKLSKALKWMLIFPQRIGYIFYPLHILLRKLAAKCHLAGIIWQLQVKDELWSIWHLNVLLTQSVTEQSKVNFLKIKFSF